MGIIIIILFFQMIWGISAKELVPYPTFYNISSWKDACLTCTTNNNPALLINQSHVYTKPYSPEDYYFYIENDMISEQYILKTSLLDNKFKTYYLTLHANSNDADYYNLNAVIYNDKTVINQLNLPLTNLTKKYSTIAGQFLLKNPIYIPYLVIYIEYNPPMTSQTIDYMQWFSINKILIIGS